MIVCKNCEFNVDNSMRHSLVKNCCPCCGSALLGDLHTRRLGLMKQRILEQEFSQQLNNDLIFDISLFMMSEFFPVNIDVVNNDEEVVDEEVVDEEVVDEEVVDEEVVDEDYDSIREEIRSEALTKIDGFPEDSDADLKVARLKRIAKESKPRAPGPLVRRVSD